MKNLKILLGIGVLIILLLLAINAVYAPVVTEDEYMEALLVVLEDVYRKDVYGGGEKFSREEALDLIEYYVNNKDDLSAHLSNVGTHSGKQIWTIMDMAGAPCDCTPGAPCTISGEKCCCRGVFYECNIIWGYTKDCTQGCCGNLCCEDMVTTTTTIPGTTTTTITALPNCDNCRPGTTSCVITCPDGSVPFSITGFLIQSCSCSGNTCDVQHSGGSATGIPCPTTGAFTFNLPFIGQISIPWPF